MPDYVVEHSEVISSPLEKVFALVADFRQRPRWSPWLIVEPGARTAFDADGKGYSWAGDVVGVGSIRREQLKDRDMISCTLRFEKPFKATSSTTFRFQSEGTTTRVTWTVKGSLPFFLFFLKPMISSGLMMDFKRGLAMLKDCAETGSVPSHLEFIGKQTLESCAWIGVNGTCPASEIEAHMGEAFHRLMDGVGQGQITPVGEPFAIYHKWDIRHGIATFTVAFPVDGGASAVPSGFSSGTRPSARVFTVRHHGPYRHLANAWAAVMMRRQAKILRAAKRVPSFEIYISDPQSTPENELITDVHFPVAG